MVKNLDNSDMFILGREYVRNSDVMIGLINGLIRIRKPDWKYIKRPVRKIITEEHKIPNF